MSTTLLSTPTTISVQEFPYSTPASRQAVLIGSNSSDDIRPPSHSVSHWRYSLFESFGGGCYVLDYSMGGAYVLAGTGGHASPPNFGAAVFDFADATWKRIDNSNGMAWRVGDISASETTGAPDYAIALGGVTANAMPAPPHTYLNALPIARAKGGGTKGSIVLVICQAQTVESRGTHRSYRFDLATGAWSRLSTNRQTDAINVGGGPWAEAPSVYDPVTNRYYQLPNQVHYISRYAYLDGNDWTWKAAPQMPTPPQTVQSTAAFLDPSRNLILITSKDDDVLLALNLNNIAGGVVRLNKSGALPAQSRWDYYPSDGCFYTYSGSGAQAIHKLTPPASNPLTGTWTVSTVAISGATLSPQQNEHGVGHYSRFFYVPPLQCFAWIAGGANRVALVKP